MIASVASRAPNPILVIGKSLQWVQRKTYWKLDVKVPHEALTFKPEEDALLASVQIAVEASALDGPLRDSFTDDWLLSYTGPEYKEVRDADAVRSVTLQLAPGRWEHRYG